jgi:tetratricopeptide (TPR) repeat protein
LDLAGALYQQVLDTDPDHGQALCGLGAFLAQTGQLAPAVEILRRAVAASAARPHDAALAAANLGNALLDLGRAEEALSFFSRAASVLANHPDLHVNAGNALRALGRTDEAEQSYAQALHLAPGHVRALIARGNLCDAGGRLQQALRDFERAAELAPGDVLAQFNRATVLHRLQRLDDSAQAFEQILALQPRHADAHFNLGIVRKSQGQNRAARTALDAAVALRPDHADSWLSRGHLFQDLAAYAEALESYDRALALRPHDAGALLTRGDCLHRLGRHADAAESFARGLAIAPDHVDAANAHMAKAICHLLLGELELGFAEFEWRWGDPKIHPPHRFGVDRLWLGHADISGSTVLVHTEQGYGDILQFCRYAPLLAQRGANVILEVPLALQDLLRSLPGVGAVRIPERTLPAFDWHVPFLTLPLAMRTRLDTIPAALPYLSAPDSAVAQWRVRLGAAHRPRIGIAWSGNPRHGNDANRSLALAQLESLLRGEDAVPADWVSLQKDVREADRPSFDRIGLQDWGPQFANFGDTAALIGAVDLVVSVDTSIAHLAGALGKRVWILLPHVPDWRWMLGRPDSPWYPGARLFRQQTAGQWEPTLERLRAELRAFVDDWHASRSGPGAGLRS